MCSNALRRLAAFPGLLAVAAFVTADVTRGQSACPDPNEQTITVRSGNGSPGGPDAAVTFLAGPQGGAFVAPFTAIEFDGAKTGPAAAVLSPPFSTLIASDPAAQWIGTSQVISTDYALYAVTFDVTVPVSTANLVLHFAVDNWLGDTTNPGAFLNGVALPGALYLENHGLSFSFEHHLLVADVAALLQPGTNWLHVYNADVSGGTPTSLLFSATVRVNVASFELYGGSCVAGDMLPLALDASGCASPGGAIELSIRNAFPGGTAWLVVGLGPAAITLPSGCQLLASPILLLFALPVDSEGAVTLPAVIPASAPSGAALWLQAFVVAPGGGKLGSNGLKLTVQ